MGDVPEYLLLLVVVEVEVQMKANLAVGRGFAACPASTRAV